MKKYGLFLPWLIVCIATVGSLFFSNLTHTDPCTLCWYQRILMFPLAIILGIAAFRNAYRIIFYILPLALIGLALSLYHVIMIQFFAEKNLCPTCTLKAISSEPITFPFLSLIAFSLLNALLIWLYIKHKRSKKL
jgi:disulfide bond formation protein DsbB